jgi:hypothetical protein
LGGRHHIILRIRSTVAGKASDASSGDALCVAPVFGYLALLRSAGATLGDRVLATLAAGPTDGLLDRTDSAVPATAEQDVAIIDRELARLFAVRELFLAWMQELRAGEARSSAGLPAQFLRAWSESTGRVIQLLRARRDLSAGDGGDAVLDAVYQELESRLPDPGANLPGIAAERACGDPPTATVARDYESQGAVAGSAAEKT